MGRPISGGLILPFLFALAVSSALALSALEQITNKHYERMINDGFHLRTPSALFSAASLSSLASLCLSERSSALASTSLHLPIDLFYNLAHFNLHGSSGENLRHDCRHHDLVRNLPTRKSPNRTLAIEALLSSPPRKEKRAATEGPMRFFFNTSLIDPGADPLACQRANDRVRLDDGSSFLCSASQAINSTKIQLIRNYIIPALQDVLSNLITVQQEANLTLDKNFADLLWYLPFCSSRTSS